MRKKKVVDTPVVDTPVVETKEKKGKFQIYTKKPYGDFVCSFETKEEANEFLVGRDNCQIGNPKK